MQLTDAARGRLIIERWCTLAEQRLDYLTELFETGRWQRFFGEAAFLENIREAKQAVQTWQGLLNSEASPDNRPIDLSWLGRRSTLPPRAIALPEPPERRPIRIAADNSRARQAPTFEPRPEATVPAPANGRVDQESWQLALDPELLQQRYPLLRNAF
ncbi:MULTISPECIES: TIGR03809 family protein [Rhodopseudomonas]|uniref:TIGR03809 family protein n=1 Tax=Rhodopseudomonas palustris TaxID=1076 RepID=A0A0D7EII4_RHOPL|nr:MULTISPECIES: TIGR03809 family protein [Rhodopseudomonas]KIZ40654.1 hypothetical protein OO17_17175 [Rhodopseudomonas palustris]MDF3808965.1 TIGR03809 family protein [Rhodopseudomonas sp. BAL398]WOK20037.1 TIGR03809 family protein [Rhodopseudomonas sp. BAL398]